MLKKSCRYPDLKFQSWNRLIDALSLSVYTVEHVPKSGKEKLNLVTVRMPALMHRAILNAASAEHITFAEYIRQAVTAKLVEPKK